MKPRHFPIARLSLPLASALAALLIASHADAASLYWDTDGATAGAGGTSPNGTWSTLGTTWSTSPNGTVATAGVTTGLTDDLFFSAGVTATGAYTVTLTSAQDAQSLTFRSGTATISGAGGVVNLGGTGIINVTNSLLAVPNSAVIGANTNTIIGGTAGLTKTGVGTLTLNGTDANTFTGGLNVNGGTLALNFANMATPTDLIDGGNALGFGSGNLSITSKTGAFTTNQTFGNVTVNSGGGSLLVNPNTGTATNITLGTLTSTASGGGLLIGRALSAGTGTLSITTTSNVDATGVYGGRTVFANGTAGTGYDWATNTGGAGPAYTLSAYAGYAALALGVGTDAANSRISATATMTGSRTTNSLKFENPLTAQTLTIGAGNTLTLSNGGLLFTGASVAQGPRIALGSITAGNGSGSYDLVVHQYNATAQNIAIGITGTNLALISTISSNIVDNGSNPVTLVKNGPGGLVLGGANLFTGGIVVNEGNLAFNTLTAINNNAITFNANSIVHTFGGSTTSGNITLNNNSQVTLLNNNSSFTVTGNVLGSGGISAANGGQGAITLNLNGTGNTFTGPLRFTHNNGSQSAAINVNSLADTDTLGTGNITFGAGSASSVSHNFALGSGATGALALTNRRFELAGDQVNQQINNASGQSLTISSDLMVTGTRAKNLVLGGAGVGISTFGGVIANHATPTAVGTVPMGVRTTAVVPAGTAITLASVEGIVAGAAISGTGIAGGTTIATVNPFTRQVTLSLATTGAIALGSNFTIPGVVNSISVNKNDAGTWVLSGNNSYTGPTNITAGTLNIQNANALGGTGVGTQVANAATLSLQGGFSYAAEPLTLTPGGGGSAMLLNVSSSNTWNGPITSNTATSSNVSRIQSDAGTMTLAGSVTLSGSAHQFVFQGNGAITVSGQITGVGRVTSSATGTGIRIVSNDTNNYTGATSVNGGTLAFTSIGNVGATSSALGAPVLADATIQLAASTTAGTLSYVGTALGGHTSNRVINLASTTGAPTIEANGAGPLVFTATNTATGAGIKTLTLRGTNTDDNSIGAIVDNSVTNTTSVTKNGAGKWILSGTNTYTGTTTVSAGTLLINGNSSAATGNVNVNAGTLGGTGTTGGSVSVAGGATLAPGASIESLAAASLTMAATSTFAYEVLDNSAAGADLLALGSTISLTGVTLSLDPASTAALSGGGWNIGDKLTLISYLGADITSGFTAFLDDTSYLFGSNSWLFNYNDTVAGTNYAGDAVAAGQNRFVTMTVVPEPRAALLGGLGLLALLRRRR